MESVYHLILFMVFVFPFTINIIWTNPWVFSEIHDNLLHSMLSRNRLVWKNLKPPVSYLPALHRETERNLSLNSKIVMISNAMPKSN